MMRMSVAPTRPGQQHAVTQIAETEAASAARWPQLPEVSTINAPLPLKPGATLLLTGTDERGRTVPALASHCSAGARRSRSPCRTRGSGRCSSIPVEDQTHERFWRQMLRWVVEGVPGAVDVKTTTERVDPGEAVTIEASVRDKQYVEMNGATVLAQVARPGGATSPCRCSGRVNVTAQYRGTFVTSEPGAYKCRSTRRGPRRPLAAAGLTCGRGGGREFFDPTMHAPPLQRIAEETGGRFYNADNVTGLAEDVRYAGRGVTSIEERELWNMPIILIMLMGLVCAEWGYRRAVGLA